MCFSGILKIQVALPTGFWSHAMACHAGQIQESYILWFYHNLSFLTFYKHTGKYIINAFPGWKIEPTC